MPEKTRKKLAVTIVYFVKHALYDLLKLTGTVAAGAAAWAVIRYCGAKIDRWNTLYLRKTYPYSIQQTGDRENLVFAEMFAVVLVIILLIALVFYIVARWCEAERQADAHMLAPKPSHFLLRWSTRFGNPDPDTRKEDSRFGKSR